MTEMSKPKQQIQWTVLPNGIKDSILRFSVFTSIELTNPPETPNLTLSSYPDIANWPETLSQKIRFALVFENGPTLTEQALADNSQSSGLRRITHPRLRELKNLWNDVFTPDQTPLRPVNQSISSSGAAPKIASFSSRRLLNISQSHYPLATSLTGMPPGNGAAFVVSDQFKALITGDPAVPEIFNAIRQKIPSIPGPGSPRVPFVEIVSTSLFEPAPGYTRAEWDLGLPLFYLEGLKPPPSTPNVVSAETLEEFQSKLSTFSGYPDLMRRVGLVMDFEVSLKNTLGSVPASGRMAIRASWQPDASVDAENLTPWTAYVFAASTGLFEAKPRSGNQQGDYPVDAEVFHGMLNLSVHDKNEPCFQLEQIDPLAEAIKLNHYLRSNDQDTERRNQLMGTPRQAGLSLLQECYADRFFSKIALAVQNRSQVATGQNTVTLWAEDLIRGYRPDIETEDGTWQSLCARSGLYTFRNGKHLAIEDEGWVSSCAASHGVDADTLLISDTIVRWDGWSLAAPIPGSRIPSRQPSEPVPASPSLRVAFSPAKHSLPRLRYGWNYRMRIRLVDLAGNSLGLGDDRAAHWRCVLPEPRSEAYRYRRFEPLLAPDFIPLHAPDEANGESVFKLVIRSDYNVACKEIDDRHVAPPKCSELFAETHGRLDGKHSGPAADWYSKLVKYDSSAPAVFNESHYDPPYLTDPLVRAIVLQGVPGSGGNAVTVELLKREDSWPRVSPWRIHVEEDPSGPQEPDNAPPSYRAPNVDRDKGVLTIYLPKAEICSIRVTSRLSEEDLSLMGLWYWIERSFPEHTDLFRRKILQGDHWMFTPARELQLVHAVRTPLFRPQFKQQPPPANPPTPNSPALQSETPIEVQRTVGSVSAQVLTSVAAPGRSAARLSMMASWTEWLDDGLPSSQVARVSKTANAFDQSLAYADATVAFSGRHDFGDTKHRLVAYSAVAASRFSEYLKGVPPGTQTSTEVGVHVPSTVAPPTPSVNYTIPIFGWEQQVNAESKASRVRRGGGLRIYLNRPWYRSGEDELLGVIVASPGVGELANVSRWGRDPLKSSVRPGVLTDVDFLGSIPHRETLIWPAGSVTVLGHQVDYDAERQLWFSDVIIDPGESYFPFVQLALVRFQPYSLDNLHVSQVVIADFAQLAPERTAS